MDKTTDANRPVDFRRVIDVPRDGHSGSEEDHGPERHPFPGVSDNVCANPEPPIIEPDRAVDTDQRRRKKKPESSRAKNIFTFTPRPTKSSVLTTVGR